MKTMSQTPINQIGKVVITPQQPKPGESFCIEVLTLGDQPWDKEEQANIKINGMFGSKQYFQAKDTGEYLIQIVSTVGSVPEVKSLYVPVASLAMEILGKPEEDELSESEKKQLQLARRQLPILQTGKYVDDLYRITFALHGSNIFPKGRADLNRIKLDQLGTGEDDEVYEWDLGNGVRKRTRVPYLTQSFRSAMDQNTDFQQFIIRVRTKRFSEPITITRSLVIENIYASCKKRGFIVPPVNNQRYAQRKENEKNNGEHFLCKLTVRNLEKDPLKLSRKRVRGYSTSTRKRPELSPISKLPEIEIPGNSEMKIEVQVGRDMIPDNAEFFTLYLFGKTPVGLPVRAEALFEIRSTMVGSTAGKKTKKNEGMERSTQADEPVVLGGECDPYNLPDSYPENYSCQATAETRLQITPPQFINAFKGDVVVIPGGYGLIGSLLRTTSPAQNYSHSGIMTRNFDEVTHNTASEERLMDNIKRSASPHVDEHALRYMWPGIITQTVEETVYGEVLISPEKKAYTLYGFPPTSESPEFQVRPPLIIKPDPLLETEAIRDQLEQIASDVRALNGRGHYRLYCYTDPTICFNPKVQDGSWANDSTPGVCSSTIWMSMNSRSLHIEGDLEVEDIEEGAQIQQAGLDGLYYFTAEERRAAGEFLHEALKEAVKEETGSLAWLLNARDNIATQIVNTFAADRADKESRNDHSILENVEGSSAVSPDSILLYWDNPEQGGFYGYATELLFRTEREEEVTVHRWQQIEQRGEVFGIVSLSDGKRAVGCSIMIDGKTTYTDREGRYEVAGVAYGVHEIRALLGEESDAGLTTVSVTVNQDRTEKNIILEEPLTDYRKCTVEGSCTILDDDGHFTSDKNRREINVSFAWTFYVSKDSKTDSASLTLTGNKPNGKASNIKILLDLDVKFLDNTCGAVEAEVLARLEESQGKKTDIDASKRASYIISDRQELAKSLTLDSGEKTDHDEATIRMKWYNDRQQ